MESSSKTKYLILGAVVSILTAPIFVAWKTSAAIVLLIGQIGLFSAVTVSGFKLWHILVPLISYGIGFSVTGDPLSAALALVYVPVSAVITICLNKKLSRGVTVVLSAFTIGMVAFGCVVATAFVNDVTVSADGISEFLSVSAANVANSLVSEIPDSLFTNGLTREGYVRTIIEGLKYFSLSIVVLFCNLVAFSSTAVTKRAVLSLNDEESSIFGLSKNWLFVLSKPSAAVYIVCYLCLIIGGETLTLPQQIAFNTVMTAIQGGVFVMAFRHIRKRISVSGFAAIFMYIVVLYFLGLSAVAMVLSGVGLFAAFRQKSKEDNEKCEN